MKLSQTYGDEFYIEETGRNYKGFYHEIPDGYYTSFVPNDPLSKKLLKIAENNALETRSYPTERNLSLDEVKPFISFKFKSYYPSPTPEDYEIGYITRYFMAHKLNQPAAISEISEETFNSLNNEQGMPHVLYKTCQIEWVISDLGGIIDIAQVNFNTLKSIEEKFPGLSKYFLNLKQFSKI